MAKKFKTINKGVQLEPIDSGPDTSGVDPTDNLVGSFWVRGNLLKGYLDAAIREVITADQTQTLTNKIITIDDDNFTLQDDGDSTKKVLFQLSGITTSTTRTLTIPDANTTLVGTDTTQTLTNKTITIDDDNLTVQDEGDNTKKMLFQLSGITTGNTRTLTVPDASTTIVGTDATQTLSNKTFSDAVNIDDTTESTTTTTGALIVDGGVGIVKNLNVGGNTVITGNLQVDGTETKVNTAILEVEDPNIIINNGGNQATANSAKSGFTVEMSDATDARIGYDSTKTTKFVLGEVGSEIEIADISSTQTFTTKTLTAPAINAANLNFGTASDTNRILLPNDTTANLDVLTDVEALIAYDTTSQKVVFNDGVQWINIGTGGSGELNFYETGDSEDLLLADFTTGNNATFDNGGTLAGTLSVTTTAADLIRGTKSVKLIGDSTAGNNDDDWVATTVIDVPQGYRGQYLGGKFRYRFDGTSGNVKVVIKDETNTVILTNSDLTLDQFIDATNNTSQQFTFQFFCPSDCAQIKFGFQVITGEVSKTLVWDDVVITPDPFVFKDLAECQSLEYTEDQNADTQNGVAEIQFGTGLTTASFSGPSILTVVDDPGNTRTKFIASRPCSVDVSFNADMNTATRVSIVKNGATSPVIIEGSHTTAIGDRSFVSASVELDTGDFITLDGSTGIRTSVSTDLYLTMKATAFTENIITQSDIFSTDTNVLTYANAAAFTVSTLDTSPIGTYITYTYTINTNVAVQTTGSNRPTQTDADMAVNGINLFTRPHNAAGSSTLPSRFDINIGKSMKGVYLNGYSNTGKVDPLHLDFRDSVSGGLIQGIRWSYEESTGILSLNAGLNTDATVTAWTLQEMHALTFQTQTAAFITVNASRKLPLIGTGRQQPYLSVNSSTQSLGSGANVDVIFTTVGEDNRGGYNVSTGEYTIPENGIYIITARLEGGVVTPGAVTQIWETKIFVAGASALEDYQLALQTSGAAAYRSGVIGEIRLTKDQLVKIQTTHNFGSSFSLAGGATKVYLTLTKTGD